MKVSTPENVKESDYFLDTGIKTIRESLYKVSTTDLV